MGFRDDDMALRARLAALERRARDAEELMAQNRKLTDENARLKQQVAELSTLVAPPRPKTPRPIRPVSSPGKELAVSFRWEDDAGAHHKTPGGKVIKIGRLTSSHLRIKSASVSRMHAVIEVSKRAVVIIDLGSDGGTHVNGAQINKASLKDGDRLRFGDVDMVVGVGD